MKPAEAKVRIQLKNIVFATDFSPVSMAALPFVANLARGYGAKVWGFHVISPNVYPVPPSLVTPTPDENSAVVAERLGASLSEHLGDIPQEVIIAYGETWSALASMIEKNDIDLVVIGTHGRGGLGRTLLGSVAESVFRQCPCPVLTVGPKVSKHLDQPLVTKEILFATDLTPVSKAAAEHAISLAQELQAHIVLLHVIEPPKAGELTGPGDFVSSTVKLLRDLVPAEAELWCKPEIAVEYGDPAEVILEVADRRHAHLIVMGVRKPKGSLGVATHFARAIAHRVVSEAKCPVLTVRG